MKRVTIHAAAVFAGAWLAGCGQAAAGCGVASPYTPSSGAHEEQHKRLNISAVHQSLPVGTRVIVRNKRTGRSIIVRIAGRNPSLLGRIIDLSTDAMSALGIDALAPVCVEVLSFGGGTSGYRTVKVLNPAPQVASPVKHASGLPVSAHVRSFAKSAHLHAGKAKRYAKLHRANHLAKKSGRRRLAAR
jgi:rare lipoprotein A